MVRNDRPLKAARVRVVILIPIVLVAVGASSQAQGPATAGSLTPAGTGASTPESPRASRPVNWPRLHLPDPVSYRVARQTLDLAWERLARINCADLLNAFVDRAGRPLNERLRELAVDRQTYLTMIIFVDGSREMPCIKGSFAYTTPGSRVVRLCVEELKRTWQTSPEHAVSRVIHEMLHTLGLGEDPPSSAEITQRVLAGCGGR
jgi:hypothetical protein